MKKYPCWRLRKLSFLLENFDVLIINIGKSDSTETEKPVTSKCFKTLTPSSVNLLADQAQLNQLVNCIVQVLGPVLTLLNPVSLKTEKRHTDTSLHVDGPWVLPRKFLL